MSLPLALTLDHSIEPRAKLLYQTLVAHKPGSIRKLAAAVPMNRNSVFRLVKVLVRTGWVSVFKTGYQNVPIPTQPLSWQKEHLAAVEKHDKMSFRSGENKMNLLLDLLVDSGPHVRNARPWFLANQNSKEFLEYDRFHPELKMAWEFDGQQHYGPTPKFPSQREFERLQSRDKLKAQLSKEHGITLITIVAQDLDIATMLEKIPQHVPIRLFDVNSYYAKGLSEMCLQYNAFLARAIARDEKRALQNQN